MTDAVRRSRGRPRQFDWNEGLRGAVRLFWELGYEAMSMADLRARLDITQASLYATTQGVSSRLRRKEILARMLLPKLGGLLRHRPARASLPSDVTDVIVLDQALDLSCTFFSKAIFLA